MPIELVETINDNNSKLLSSPKVDGENSLLLKQYMDDEISPTVCDNVFKNAFKALPYFINPKYESDDISNLSKILAIGRVQSGKTSFFISAISLAFDNGYDLVYLVGGTKNTLRDQNYERVVEYFSNNEKIKVYDVNKVNSDTILSKISLGYKVVLVILKNSAEGANLGKANSISNDCSLIPSLVVDDEGDEYTPGAPKLRYKNARIGANHDLIQNIIYGIKHCTYLSVTATPQANFLIDTIDAVSPDYAVLVEPGDEYTGGNAFHDTLDNPHVTEILDTDDFKDSIPDSFIDAMYFFVFAACIKRARGDYSPYSMLVHPSSLTKVQNAVAEKINDRVRLMTAILSDTSNLSYVPTVEKILNQKQKYLEINPDATIEVTDDELKAQLIDVACNLVPFEFNVSSSGREDIDREKEDKSLYKIYVGGNMLGRGLTIKNLIVTYMYRDSKVQAVDTLYQRARWLGYKAKYFDVCRVFMTTSLRYKFSVIVESENDMWEALQNYLLVETNIKQFPRIFSLPDETGKMILTRKTVSKTITVERVNAGYSYDKTVWFTDAEKAFNKQLYQQYFDHHIYSGHPECFSTKDDYQTHFIIHTTLHEFYDEFLSKYIYPRGSKFGDRGFKKMLAQVEEGKLEDELVVIIMRYRTNEFRDLLSPGAKAIKELPNSYHTHYCGDKMLTGYHNKMHFQLHLVYTDKEAKDDIMPIIALNNPLSQKSIRYVTGDNVYDAI